MKYSCSLDYLLTIKIIIVKIIKIKVDKLVNGYISFVWLKRKNLKPNIKRKNVIKQKSKAAWKLIKKQESAATLSLVELDPDVLNTYFVSQLTDVPKTNTSVQELLVNVLIDP